MTTAVAHITKPSVARKAVLNCFVPVPRGSATAVPPPLCWAPKDPQDVLDYQLDFAPALVGNSEDGIATVDVTITPGDPGDLVANSVAADGSSVVIWFSGGQPNTTYVVTLLVGMTSGRVIQRSVLLPVLALSSVPPPVTAIETDLGDALVDQYGNPFLTTD